VVKVGDLVKIPMLDDVGVVVEIFKTLESDREGENTYLAEVYWQNKKRSRTEFVTDLQKIN